MNHRIVLETGWDRKAGAGISDSGFQPLYNFPLAKHDGEISKQNEQRHQQRKWRGPAVTPVEKLDGHEQAAEARDKGRKTIDKEVTGGALPCGEDAGARSKHEAPQSIAD